MKTDKKIQDDAQSLQTVVSVAVTDLRVGNWVNDPIHNKCDIELNKDTFSAFILDWKDELQPIPLTEEWILNFGIGRQNGYPYKFLNGYLKIRNGIYFFKYYDLEVELPFVHLLQNLHYTLKRSELQISSITEH